MSEPTEPGYYWFRWQGMPPEGANLYVFGWQPALVVVCHDGSKAFMLIGDDTAYGIQDVLGEWGERCLKSN